MAENTLRLYSMDIKPTGSGSVGFIDGTTTFTTGSFTTEYITVTDNDATFHDSSQDSDGEQELTNAQTVFGTSYGAGTELRSIANVVITNNTTGESGQLFLIRDVSGPYLGWASTLSISPGDNLTWTASNDSAVQDPEFFNGGVAYSNLVCFAEETLIETDRGEMAVKDLTIGSMIHTVDHGFRPIRLIRSRPLSAAELGLHPNLRPIRIGRGALGDGQPNRDLVVSPQHRILVRSWIACYMFDAPEVLVPSKFLLAIPGIAEEPPSKGIVYRHFMFDAHEIVVANGAAAESLYPGPMAMKGMTPEARTEIVTLFPELANTEYRWHPARQFLTSKQGKELARRHVKNSKPLVSRESFTPMFA